MILVFFHRIQKTKNDSLFWIIQINYIIKICYLHYPNMALSTAKPYVIAYPCSVRLRPSKYSATGKQLDAYSRIQRKNFPVLTTTLSFLLP